MRQKFHSHRTPHHWWTYKRVRELASRESWSCQEFSSVLGTPGLQKASTSTLA